MSQIKDLNEYFYEMERIELNSGRIIYMTWLQQGRTYGNQIEGLPTFRGIPPEEPWLLESNGERYLLVDRAPIPLPISDKQKEQFLKRNPRLAKSEYPFCSEAPVSCRAHFESKPTANPGEDIWTSGLTMEWRQEKFAMPIEPRVLDKIKALDWDALAKDEISP